MQLENKNALVCGSSKGIGLASAIALSKLGANITLVARNESSLKEAISKLEICSKYQKHDFIPIDMQDLERLKQQIINKQLENKSPFTILINNNGGPAAGPIINANIEQFSSAFHNHLLVNHTLVSLLLDGMKQEKFGRIVNIISTSVKQPLPNLGVSNTIRAAVANWSKTLATEIAKYGITVNNVLPGATNTERLNQIITNKSELANKDIIHIQNEMINEIPMQRFAEPEEIANAVAFLCSKQASYITGINLPVDGGRTLNL